jgi:hypothetical protein
MSVIRIGLFSFFENITQLTKNQNTCRKIVTNAKEARGA